MKKIVMFGVLLIICGLVLWYVLNRGDDAKTETGQSDDSKTEASASGSSGDGAVADKSYGNDKKAVLVVSKGLSDDMIYRKAVKRHKEYPKQEFVIVDDNAHAENLAKFYADDDKKSAVPITWANKHTRGEVVLGEKDDGSKEWQFRGKEIIRSL